MPFLTFMILSVALLIERINLIREISFMGITSFHFQAGFLFLLPVSFFFIITGVFRKRKRKRCFTRILKEIESKRRKKEKRVKDTKDVLHLMYEDATFSTSSNRPLDIFPAFNLYYRYRRFR
jgi:hypothetical protein